MKFSKPVMAVHLWDSHISLSLGTLEISGIIVLVAVSRCLQRGFPCHQTSSCVTHSITILEGNSHLSTTTCVLKEETQFVMNSAGGSLERTRYLLQKLLQRLYIEQASLLLYSQFLHLFLPLD